MPKLNYVELPVADVGTARSFYTAAFGWTFTDYGPDYSAVEGGSTTIGYNGDTGQQTKTILALIEVDDLEAALAAVQAAGGTIRVPIFSYPGGRRFHFADPDGLELGVYTVEG